MKNKTKKALCAASILGVVAISGIFAYLIDTDSKTNQFTIGDVDIELLEPSWVIDDETVLDENDNDIPDFAENIVPNQVIAKDPQVENKGSSSAYVFLEVKVPVIRADFDTDNGTPAGPKTEGQMFNYTIDDKNWVLIEDEDSPNQFGNTNNYVYCYKGELAPGDTTDPLFQQVQLANFEKDYSGFKEGIEINAYAIQSEGLDTLAEGLDLEEDDDYIEFMQNVFGAYWGTNQTYSDK